MSAPPLTIRTATPADTASLLTLVQSAYRGEGSRAGWTTEADLLDDKRIDAAGITAKIENADGAVLVVLDREHLVGCCEIAYRGAGIAYFGMFAVTPARQSSGIGRAVLAAAEEFAVQQWQATTMEMTVIGQRDELIAWYQRRGYSLTGERRPFPYAELIDGQALRDDLYFAVLAKPLDADSPGGRQLSEANSPSW
jgi:ribosomal protein S18 acetylase RimI-like enzyme